MKQEHPAALPATERSRRWTYAGVVVVEVVVILGLWLFSRHFGG